MPAPFVLRNQNGTSARTRRCSATRYASTRSRVGRVTSPSVGRSCRLTAPILIGPAGPVQSRRSGREPLRSGLMHLAARPFQQSPNARREMQISPGRQRRPRCPMESARTFRDGTLIAQLLLAFLTAGLASHPSNALRHAAVEEAGKFRSALNVALLEPFDLKPACSIKSQPFDAGRRDRPRRGSSPFA